MKISLSAALDVNRVIGRDNQLPWRLPKEMKRFRQITMGKPVLMGRKTFASLQKPLPERYNIILTRDPSFSPPPGCSAARSLAEGLSLAEARGAEEAVVIGGEALFQEALPRAERLYLSVIEGSFPGDTYFPTVTGRFRLTEHEVSPADEKNPYAFHMLTLERIPQSDAEGDAFDLEAFLARLKQSLSL